MCLCVAVGWPWVARAGSDLGLFNCPGKTLLGAWQGAEGGIIEAQLVPQQPAGTSASGSQSPVVLITLKPS